MVVYRGCIGLAHVQGLDLAGSGTRVGLGLIRYNSWVGTGIVIWLGQVLVLGLGRYIWWAEQVQGLD